MDYDSIAARTEEQFEEELKSIRQRIEKSIVNQYDDHSCLKLNMEQLITLMNESIELVAKSAKELIAVTVNTMYRRESCLRHTMRTSCNQSLRDSRSALHLEHDHSVEALTAQYQIMERQKSRDYQTELENTIKLLGQTLEQRSTQDKKILEMRAHNFLTEQHLGIKLMELDQERESHSENKLLFNQELAHLRRKEVESALNIITLKKSLKKTQEDLVNKSNECEHIWRQSLDLEQKLNVSKKLRTLLEKKYRGCKLKLKLYEEGKLSSITRTYDLLRNKIK